MTFDPEAATRTPPKKVIFRVKRYNPETGKTWWDEYEVETYRGMTVLDALLKIKEEIDHTIVMRYSCRMGVCGSCGMIINGMPRLACQTQVAEVATEANPVITIEPLKNHPVLRDLVTDFTAFFEKHRSVKPYTIRKDKEELETGDMEYLMSPEEHKELYEYTLCIACGLCYSACPVAASDERFLGPQALTYVWRYVSDPRDEAWQERLEAVDVEGGPFSCHYAASCSAVCPKMVDPGAAIQRLRSALIKYRLGLYKKKKVAKKATRPAEQVKPKKPLPPEAQPVPGANIEAMEREPPTIPVEQLIA
ncbi:MAG: succinate dehydrogenase/fumarate reductase iron-sulfur subunit [Desulfurococcales archaeon]|nr:succinate dehydrogenase/fumarate reductase iron-sulfur subunit [Desulfurococcales archaeon]